MLLLHDEPQVVTPNNRFKPCVGTKLGEDIFYVVPNGVGAHCQAAGHRCRALPGGKKSEYLNFSWGQQRTLRSLIVAINYAFQRRLSHRRPAPGRGLNRRHQLINAGPMVDHGGAAALDCHSL